jgi:hypothetical protein
MRIAKTRDVLRTVRGGVFHESVQLVVEALVTQEVNHTPLF